MARVFPRRLVLCGLCLAAGCAAKPPVVSETMQIVRGDFPVDLSGSWERNYARGDDIGQAYRDAYYRLQRTIQDRQYASPSPVPAAPRLSGRDEASLLALARLAELITRPDVLTIVQDDVEIRVEREHDFAMLCSFYAGVAKPTESPYGTEICGWDGSDLVSHLILPDGLQVTHRFTISTDRRQLRVITTVASSTARVPITIRRFYAKFRRPKSSFNCIETLSMKRVCSTGEFEP